MFGLWKYFRRRRLQQRALPDTWLAGVTEYLPIFPYFSEPESRQFIAHLKILMWEKLWIGAHDFELDERTRVIIAAQGARMARGLPLSVFDRLSEFVIYGGDFVHPEDELPGPVFGEAHPFGTVILSWPACEEGLQFPCMGFNTILHEMAHILDLTNGTFNGTPLLHSGRDYKPWAKAFQKHFDAMLNHPEESFLDLYGAGDESEFFAVAVEAFFDVPDIFADEAPDLFSEMRRYFGVDPEVIPCTCESHEVSDEVSDEAEEMGRPFLVVRDPLE